MNFQTLVIAGLGTIGSSIIRLGDSVLQDFENIIVVDKQVKLKRFNPKTGPDVMFKRGDVENKEFLFKLFQYIEMPALFLNLCSGTDNIRIRKILSLFDVAYIDSCASSIFGRSEYRFSRLMPHTLTQIPSRFPHWLCWGINPGLVEIIVRKIVKDFNCGKHLYDVTIFEHDLLDAEWVGSKVPVAWSPRDLVEEVMISPSFQIVSGKKIEGEKNGAEKIASYWEGTRVNSRLVGHEDIWNIGGIKNVNSAKFIYALNPKVMGVFDGNPLEAQDILRVPREDVHIWGKEKVAVQVKNISAGTERTLLWEIDHEEVWKKHCLNAVQFQTAKSLLLAVILLQKTHYGNLSLSCCASDLPIAEGDWNYIETAMSELDIHWKNADFLDLHVSR